MITYLYIKKHSITGMMYFGKTSKKDPYLYNGSGKLWKRHIEKHGKEHVETVWVSKAFDDKSDLIEFATFFSEEFDIVNSSKWANLIIENGVDGWTPGVKKSAETRKKMSEAVRPQISKESCRKMSISQMGHDRKHSPETRKKMSEASRPPISEETKLRMSTSRMGKKRGPYKTRSV
jgi:hypothetical protein